MLSGPRNRNRRRAARIFAAIIAAVAAACALTAWLLGNHYKQLIRKELPAAIAKATDSLYQVIIEDVHVNLFTRHLTIDGIHLWPDPARLERLLGAGKAPPAVADIRIPELQVQGASWYRRRDGRHINLRRLWLGSPQLHIIIYPKDSSSVAYHPLHHAADRLAGIRIGSIAFEEPQVTLTNLYPAEPWQSSIAGGEVVLRQFEYRPGAAADSSRLLNSGSIEAHISQWQWQRRSGGWYRLTCDSLRLNSAEGNFALTGFAVEPTMGNAELYAAAGRRMEIYRARVPRLQVEGFSLPELVRRNTFLSTAFSLTGPSLDVYFSRLGPPRGARLHGTFPQQLLARLPIALHIPALQLQDGSIAYTEVSDITGLPATIKFSEIGGTVQHLSSLPAAVRRQPECRAQLRGHFQKRTDMTADLRLRLDDSACGFRFSGRLGALDAVQINDQARAWAMAEVRNLRVHELRLDVSGNRDSTRGSATLLYDRLKLKVQAVDSITRQLRVRPFISLLANKLLLYPSNPMPGAGLRSVETAVVPETGEPFLHIIWRHLFQAGARTTIHDEGMLEALRNRGERRAWKAEHGRRRFFKDLFPKRKR